MWANQDLREDRGELSPGTMTARLNPMTARPNFFKRQRIYEESARTRRAPYFESAMAIKRATRETFSSKAFCFAPSSSVPSY